MLVSAATASSSSSSTAEKPKRKKNGGFVEEMRHVAMKMHTRDQAKEGENEQEGWVPLHKWEPSIQGYLKFLVDSKLLYDTLDKIIENADPFLYYAEFQKTGLERAKSLEKDLEWFIEQGHVIPNPTSAGLNYAQYLEDIAGNNPQSFLCHFYNIYFAHTAGGRMIGKKVAEKILDKKELEFYKWDGDLSLLLQNVREKLNRIAESWTLEQKRHCLEETEKSFKFSLDTVRLILS